MAGSLCVEHVIVTNKTFCIQFWLVLIKCELFDLILFQYSSFALPQWF